MICDETDDPSFAAFRARRDEASLRALMVEHLPGLRATVRRVLSRRDLAEDAVQEAFVQLSRKHDTVRGPLGPWLRRVALNAALDLLRIESAQRRNGIAFELIRQSASPVDGLDPEVKAMIGGCIARLPEQHRSVIARGFFLGLSQGDIAAEDGITQVAVHKRMRAALAALRWEILRSGLGDSLGAFGQREEEHSGLAAIPADPMSMAVLALFGLPRLLGMAGAAGASAGIAAAAWTDCDPDSWDDRTPPSVS
jgi:RNA polymerase sigma-70 factor, ECF subfamily